jgi:hypothetical protein
MDVYGLRFVQWREMQPIASTNPSISTHLLVILLPYYKLLGPNIKIKIDV